MSLDSLFLKKFGKFENKGFDFKDFNLFFGKNEAGKSTLADALFCVLADKNPGKTYLGRYESTELSAKGKTGYIDLDALANVFAIRSGSVVMSLDSKSNKGKLARWIQDAVFNNEVNLDKLVDSLAAKVAIDKKNYKAGKDFFKKQTEIMELKQRISQNSAVVENEAKKSSESKKLAEKKHLLEEELVKLKEKENELKQRIEGQRKLDDYKRIRSYLERINKVKNKEAELVSMTNYGSLMREGKDLEERIRELEQEEYRTRLRLEDCEKNMENARRLSEEKRKLISAKKELIAELRDCVLRLRFSTIGGIIGIGILLVGIFLMLPFSGLDSFLSGLLVAIPGGSLFATSFLYGFFYKKTFLSARNLSGKLGQLITELDSEMYGLSSSLREQEERLVGLENEKNKLSGELFLVQTQLTDSRRAYDSWRIKSGVENSSALGERERMANEKRRELDEDRRVLAKLREEYKAGSNEELTTRLMSECDMLEKELPAEELDDMAKKMLNAEYARVQKAIADSESEINSIDISLSRIKGELYSSSNMRLMMQLEQDKKELARLNSELEEMKKDVEAYRIAGSVFSAIRDELASDFGLIVEKMVPYFSAITGDKRDIRIDSLNITDIIVEDATSCDRGISLLSKGTQAAFFLAARLGLAELTADRAGLVEDGVLIFDEPFESLDSMRRKGAIEAIRMFFERHHGWQGFFFTSFEEVRELVISSFPSSFLAVFELEA
ncbi:AAA family ATPase [Spirochaetia bacterium 38H-sp]|uniref:AAA family ATPase n=1 Tax=Rarispira pelagica TaxID=3141764 RepID=A0ABU9UAD2_9SPIR